MAGHAYALVASLTGNYGKRGTGCGIYCYHVTPYNATLGAWPLPEGAKTTPSTMGFYDIVQKPNNVHAAFFFGDIPTQKAANWNKTRAWLESLDFVALADIYHSSVADYVDLVLPVCSKFECADEVGGIKCANAHILENQKVIDPLFESKSDFYIEKGIAEAMGLTMPGSACAHAVSGKKNRVAKESGMAVVRLVEEDIRPRDIVTQEMLELAVRVGLSVGGSTNMTLHMPAIAHEAKLHMSLEEIGRLSAETPYLAKIKPSGSHTMLDLDQAGGVGAVMRELDGLINLDQMTVNGKTHRQNVERVVEHNPEVIRPVSDAYSDHGSITVLKGNLAPDGAVIKQSAVAAAMRRHSGPARSLSVRRMPSRPIYGGVVQHGEVLVIRNEGPPGRPRHAGDADRHRGTGGHGLF